MLNSKQNTKISLIFLTMFLLWLALLALRLFASEFGESGLQSVLWLEFFFLFVLYGYIIVTALGLGRILVRYINVGLNNIESTLLASMLGLGALSMGIAVLGFISWLTPAGVFVVLSISGLLSLGEWGDILRSTWTIIRKFRIPHAESLYESLLHILIVAMIPVLLVHVLTPVWDYDALLYHLEVPNRFIAHGGFYFDPDMMRSAYPYLGEMLFVVGIMFRLESVSKFLHLTYAILFILSVYAFGERFFNRDISLSAIGILISGPSFILWSTWAGIDFAWAGYELWSVYVISIWAANENKQSVKWMALAGIMSGMAASTKYISIPSIFIVAILIIWVSMYRSKLDIIGAVGNLKTFGLYAGLAMGPWYIKNLILTGNPVYPLVFGGPGWGPLENQVLNDYVGSFGLGKSLLDFLTLPYNVYAQQERFSTMSQEIVHPLLWLAFLFPFWLKTRKQHLLIVYMLIYYGWWFFGSQVIRFLLPVSALMALIASTVIEQVPLMLKSALKFILIAGLLIFNLVYQTLILQKSGMYSYVVGQKTTAEILQLFVEDYGMKQFIQEHVDPAENVLFLWDGRGYYCDSRCIPDSEHSAAVSLTINMPQPTDLAQQLKNRQITYLMLSSTDANFAIDYHDPNGLHLRALDYYNNIFLPACGKSVFKDGTMELFHITCQ